QERRRSNPPHVPSTAKHGAIVAHDRTKRKEVRRGIRTPQSDEPSGTRRSMQKRAARKVPAWGEPRRRHEPSSAGRGGACRPSEPRPTGQTDRSGRVGENGGEPSSREAHYEIAILGVRASCEWDDRQWSYAAGAPRARAQPCASELQRGPAEPAGARQAEGDRSPPARRAGRGDR